MMSEGVRLNLDAVTEPIMAGMREMQRVGLMIQRQGMYRWRAASSGRLTKWHLYLGEDAGRTVMRCGVSASRGVLKETFIATTSELLEARMMGDRVLDHATICRACLIDLDAGVQAALDSLGPLLVKSLQDHGVIVADRGF